MVDNLTSLFRLQSWTVVTTAVRFLITSTLLSHFMCFKVKIYCQAKGHLTTPNSLKFVDLRKDPEIGSKFGLRKLKLKL